MFQNFGQRAKFDFFRAKLLRPKMRSKYAIFYEYSKFNAVFFNILFIFHSENLFDQRFLISVDMKFKIEELDRF